jgi:hypothetical protein
MPGGATKTEAGSLAGARRQWRSDEKQLAKAPADDSMTPHIARLEPFQLLEVERMAGQGMDMEQIGARLRYPPDVWAMLIQVNPEIAQAVRAGKAFGMDKVTQAGLKGAIAGDASLIKWYAGLHGGPQFQRKPDGPAVVISPGSLVQIDYDRLAARFERQRQLIDGTAEELRED